MKSIIPFKPSSSMCISGATQTGKTTFVYKLLNNLQNMFEDPAPEYILYCYGIFQPLFTDMENKLGNITFHKDMPDVEYLDNLLKKHKSILVIFDDLAHQLLNSNEAELLFTQGCHHKNITTIFITQNLFRKGRHAKSIALNTQYLVLFQNLRDQLQVEYLSRQIFPEKPKVLSEAYKNATSLPFGYLVVDLFPTTEEKYRLRTNIFPGEYPSIYSAKK